MEERYRIIRGDAIEELSKIDESIIHLIACDLPYGTTQNTWDCVLDLDSMWYQFNRVLRENGKIVLTATQPFTSALIMSNIKNFKYDIVWEKTVSSNQLNVSHQPLRSHESILVFYNRPGVYNEQLTEGEPYSIERDTERYRSSYGSQKASIKENDGYRHARSVVKISNPRKKGGHPTEKPVELMEYIIKTYSNPNDIVLDPTMGCGSTGVAALNLNRRFIGIDLDQEFFDVTEGKLKLALKAFEIKSLIEF